jgi:hypothetical protein
MFSAAGLTRRSPRSFVVPDGGRAVFSILRKVNCGELSKRLKGDKLGEKKEGVKCFLIDSR